MGMSTSVIIGHFLRAEGDISAIVNSEQFEDTVIDTGDGYYCSNHGNTLLNWSNGDFIKDPILLSHEHASVVLVNFLREIKPITDVLNMAGIKYEVVYGAKTWVS